MYDLSAHPPTPPVMPIITTTIDSLNVTAELDEFKNAVAWTILNWSTATICTPSNDFRPKVYRLFKYIMHSFCTFDGDYTFPEDYLGRCKLHFKLNWLNEMPGFVCIVLSWMEYFAIPVICTIFLQTVTCMVSLLNKSFHGWHRKSDKLAPPPPPPPPFYNALSHYQSIQASIKSMES